MIFRIILYCLILLFSPSLSLEDDDATIKCDACKILAAKFADSFKAMELESKSVPLNEDDYIEAAEATCDEDWSGYSISEEKSLVKTEEPTDEVENELWFRRLQDYCDEILSESKDEKTLYDAYLSGALESNICSGDGVFGACKSVNFHWPGSEYDDEEPDIDYIHDEF